jgi:hypothetical protein
MGRPDGETGRGGDGTLTTLVMSWGSLERPRPVSIPASIYLTLQAPTRLFEDETLEFPMKQSSYRLNTHFGFQGRILYRVLRSL